MKILRKILTYGMWLCMLIPLFTQMSIRAEALAGMGTPDSPYLVYTLADVLAIAQNPAGSYTLMADIDMSSVTLFTPIGNETTGPFTGVLDGNGHTISGLFIYHPTAKAAGFVAYNEGTIKNLIIDAEVCGGRYTGGIAAHNSGTVDNCAMKGEVYTNGAPMDCAAGGIVGYNEGAVQNCVNFAEVSSEEKGIPGRSLYLGGNIGIHESSEEVVHCVNYGIVKSDSGYCGGIIGKITTIKATINRCSNYGSVLCSAGASGGIISQATIGFDSNNCSNSAPINGSTYCGGLVAKGASNVYINSFVNVGDVTVPSASTSDFRFAAGIFACPEGTQNVLIENSYNGGNIYGGRASGLVSASFEIYNSARCREFIIQDSLNTGDIKGQSSGAFLLYSGVYYDNSNDIRELLNGKTYNCHNIGHVDSQPYEFSRISCTAITENCLQTGVITSRRIQEGEFRSSYVIDSAMKQSLESNANKTNIYHSLETLKNQATYVGWDFENTWDINPAINSGMPYLRQFVSYYPMQYRIVLEKGQGEYVRIPGLDSSLANYWESSDTSIAIVDDNGYVMATGYGSAVISCSNLSGYRTACVVLVQEFGKNPVSEVAVVDVNLTQSYTLMFLNMGKGDYIVRAETNSECASINYKSASSVALIGQAPGTGFLTVTTATGATCTVPYTVTANITALTIPSTATVNRGGTTALTLTRTPAASTTPIVWSTSDDSIAKVDQNGVVTGVALGTVTITAKAENGVTDTCSVTVKAPVEKLDMMRTAVTLTVGDTDRLSTIFAPLDTTDTITYSTSSSTYVTVVSSTGEITAKRAGQATITAKASSGLTAQCIVTVVDASAEGVGAPIGGQFVSNDPTTETTLQLWQNGRLVRTAAVGTISGSDQTVQDFVIEGVKKGTYDLHIVKPGCFPVIITGIYVDGTTPVALTEHSNPNVRLIKLVAGDLNGDGACNLIDAAILQQNESYGKTKDDFIFSYVDPHAG